MNETKEEYSSKTNSNQTFAYKLERIITYFLIFTMAIAVNDYADRLFDTFFHKKNSIFFNTLYIIVLFLITLIFIWATDAKVNV